MAFHSVARSALEAMLGPFHIAMPHRIDVPGCTGAGWRALRCDSLSEPDKNETAKRFDASLLLWTRSHFFMVGVLDGELDLGYLAGSTAH